MLSALVLCNDVIGERTRQNIDFVCSSVALEPSAVLFAIKTEVSLFRGSFLNILLNQGLRYIEVR